MELRGCIKSPPAERLRGARLRLRPWRREGPRPRSCPGTGGRQRWERGRQSRAHTDTRGCGQGRILPGDAAAGRALPREDAGGGVRGADASLGRVIFGEGGGCTDGVGVLSILRDSIPANIPLPDLADRETEAHPLFPAASSPQHPHPCWPGDASCPDLFATLPSCFVN